MAVIKITDLPTNLDLDRKAMSSIQGGGGQWVFGPFRPYVKAPSETPHFGGPEPINFYQITNNNYFVENKSITLTNSGSNSTARFPSRAASFFRLRPA